MRVDTTLTVKHQTLTVAGAQTQMASAVAIAIIVVIMFTSVHRIIAVQVLMHKPPHGRSLGRLRSTHLVRVLVHAIQAIPTTTAIQLMISV